MNPQGNHVALLPRTARTLAINQTTQPQLMEQLALSLVSNSLSPSSLGHQIQSAVSHSSQQRLRELTLVSRLFSEASDIKGFAKRAYAPTLANGSVARRCIDCSLR